MDWLLARKMLWFERTETNEFWFRNVEHHDFLKAMAFDAHSSGTLRLARLRVDSKTIAAKLGFLHKGRFDVLVSAYDRDWLSYGPSQILTEECLEWSFRNNVRVFDFRIGDESYKYVWANRQAAIGVHLIPCTRRGRLYVAWFGSSLRGGLKKAFRKVPKGFRHLVIRLLKK
jgi:CelD/BcsL family acetyltransferase involved in cellulose biosynthesis